MKKRGFTSGFLILLSMAVLAQSYQKTEQGVKAQINSMDIAIQFYGPLIVRVVKAPAGSSFEKESLSVVKTPEEAAFTLKRKGKMVLLKNKSIEVALNLDSGTVSFRSAVGKVLLTEKEGSATFTDFDDAVRIANDTLYGLGAGVWSRDGNTAYRAGRAIQAGRVWVNNYHAYPAHAAFGGYKSSGIGRENHLMMLDHYQQTKNLLVSYKESADGFF